MDSELGPDCVFCGGRIDPEYRRACRACGLSYCHIHMQAHVRSHGQRQEGERTEPAADAVRADESGFRILTSDPEEIRLVRTYMMNLFGPAGSPRPLERNLE